MPAAAIPIISAGIGGAGSIASGASGKKAQNKANQLAQQQLGLEQGLINKAQPLIGGASDYWNALMKGGQAAVQATGPIASQIGQAYQGARNSIAATTPRGGEQNLAMAQNYNQASNDVARLYAGMQPMAAQNLSQLGGLYLGAGQGLAYPASLTRLGAAQMGMANAQQGAQGFGSLLYNSLNKLGNRGGGGGTGSGMALSNLLTGMGGGPQPIINQPDYQIG